MKGREKAEKTVVWKAVMLEYHWVAQTGMTKAARMVVQLDSLKVVSSDCQLVAYLVLQWALK